VQYIAYGGLVSILLTVLKALFPQSLDILPLGGSSISELGIVFGLAVVTATMADLRKSMKNKDE
jgi:hypothetical protein